MTAVGDAPSGRLTHEALFFERDAVLLERCVPFITGGLDAGEPVLVVAGDAARRALTDALGPDADRVAAWEDAALRSPGGPEARLAWARSVRDQGGTGTPWRVVTEPVWLREPIGAPWHRFESVLNRAYAGSPCHCLCLHDLRHLPDDVVATARRTHPLVSTGAVPHRSDDFEEPESFVPSAEPPPSDVSDDAVSGRVASARAARQMVGSVARRVGADRGQAVVLAASELVANALEAGRQPTVQVWVTGAAMHVEVADDGPGGLDPLAGYAAPEPNGESGRGLWLARALADDASVRSGEDGTVIRLQFRLR